MRLFAALWPPPAAVEELDREVAALRELPDAVALRWTRPANRHITLSFYGEADERARADLAARLGRAAHRAGGPVPMRLAGGGRFGGHTLWTGIRQESPERDALRRLAAATTAAGRRAGLLPADAPPSFRPHLTLARARGRGPGVDLRPFVAGLEPFRGSGWWAGELLLIRSVPPTGGVPGEQPYYEPLARWPLGGGPGR
ncbi:RNA 2',3'-cyclic phosphodiesterase [Streptomyces sp. AA1529]|uniref:RNA 2',3'-cyclic phosphodiesterase n=1 Tax=Streptomyces sp. AA1529 TaxID=1203257 RepID=UPI000303D295|nr:RNA 2',3'-cyclic phosphodiesterase [Streptomyces sp. AA1529]